MTLQVNAPASHVTQASRLPGSAVASRTVDRRLVVFFSAAIVYYAGTLLSFWAAYDRSAALGRLLAITAGLIVAAAVMVLARRGHQSLVAWSGIACLVLAVLLGAYFLQTFDWQAAGPGKVAIIYRLGLWLQANRPAALLPYSEAINGNVAGSAMVILLPLGLGGAAWLFRNRNAPSPLTILGTSAVAAATVFVLFTVLLTLSRGAWLAVGAALVSALFMIWRRHLSRDHLWLDISVFAAFVLFSAGLFVMAVTLPGSSSTAASLDSLLGSASSLGGSGAGRVSLWRDMLPLLADYPFTGSGLGSTMMVFSSYILMLHVGFITHAHHLFLQIGVEQGIPAMVAFGVMVGTAAWGVLRSGARKGWASRFPAPAALAAIVALLVHGMVDAGPYGSRLIPLTFLPLGFAIAAWAPPAGGASLHSGRLTWATIITIAAGFVTLLVVLPVTRSAIRSNLGAVAQTRAELSLYNWPEWSLQDVLRRSGAIDLGPAIQHYEAALRLDPINASANRRLGQIELSLGRYDVATRHLQAAFDAAPNQRPTRQLLAETRAIGGSSEGAAELWRTLSLSQQQLELRRWWYEEIGEPEAAARIAAAARLAGW